MIPTHFTMQKIRILHREKENQKQAEIVQGQSRSTYAKWEDTLSELVANKADGLEFAFSFEL